MKFTVYENLFKALETEFDKDRALGFVKGIWENDRWFRTPSFVKTARYCAALMREMGLADIEMLPVKADGRTPYGDWVLPRAWNARSASLKLIGKPPGPDVVLCDYQLNPCSLIMYSAPHPLVETAAVLVDDPTRLPDVSLEGKIIVTRRIARELVPIAVKYGAIGIASDYIPLYPGIRDTREQMAGFHRWDNDFIVPTDTHGLFGFSLDPAGGSLLRSLLKEGPVRLAAEVDTLIYEGESYTVSGAIPGQEADAGELVAFGHLYEPGANDNASGCAVLLELARCIQAGLRKGKIPAPRRTIRFVFGHECVGSMAYVSSHPERIGKTHFALVADMVGTEKIDKARLGLYHNPIASWSCLDALAPEIVNAYQRRRGTVFEWDEKVYGGGDSHLADPCFKMSSVMYMAVPALSYHSSMDIPDRIEPDILMRNGILMGTLLLFCAGLGPGEAPWLREKILEDIKLRRQHEAGHRKGLWDIARSRALAEPEELPPVFRQLPEGVSEAEAAIVPVRLVKGSLTFAAKPIFLDQPWPPAPEKPLNVPTFWGGNVLGTALFWADGKRNLWQIAVLSWLEGDSGSSPENSQVRGMAEHFHFLKRYFTFLSENGYMRLTAASEKVSPKTVSNPAGFEPLW
jgi:hypothetical protein